MNINKVSKWIIFSCLQKTVKATDIKYKLLLLFLLTGVVACSESAMKYGTKVIENDQIKLVFATKPVPFLMGLMQKQSRTNLLPDTADHNLFTIEVSQPEGKTLTIESKNAKKGSLKVARDNSGQSIMISYTGLGPAGDIQVSISGFLDNEEPLVRWSFTVDNPNRQKIVTVRFPYVTTVPSISTPEDDFIIAPAFPGSKIENPAINWPANYQVGWTFPGLQSVQFCSFQDQNAGVYIASMDTAGHGRALQVIKHGNKDFVLYQEYRVPDQPEAQWRSPYEVALGVTSGPWQQTADIYKRWAVHQSWCKRTLDKRDDIPVWWKQGPCVHICGVRSQEGDHYSTLLKHLLDFRGKIDGPVVPMLSGWEKHGTWMAGDYFPVFGEKRAEDAFNRLRKNDFLPFFYLSGLYYTVSTEGKNAKTLSGFDRYIKSFVIDQQTGKPKIHVLKGGDKWNRNSHVFCTAAPGTKEFFLSLIGQSHSAGSDVIQMDQTTGGASDACYSTWHNHKPGPGLYQFESFCQLLTDIRQYGRSLSPEFVLLHEELHEELIPYFDCFHTRECREFWWYRRTPGTRGIPLFSYLYHEYALAYSAGAFSTKERNPFTVRQHAVNLVTGRLSSLADFGNHEATDQCHQDQIHMLRNHSLLLKTEAQRFLMLGRMLHPLEFDVPSVTFKLRVDIGGKQQSVPFEEKAVLTSSWQSPEGLVGHCLVNITDEKQQVHLQLDTRNAPGWPKVDIDLYHANKPEARGHILKSVSLPRDYSLELAPLEAVFFVIQPAEDN